MEFAQLAMRLDSSNFNAFRERMWAEGEGDRIHDPDQVILYDLQYPLDEGGYLMPIVERALSLNILRPDQIPIFLSFVRFMYDNRVWEEDPHTLQERKDSDWYSHLPSY